MDKKPSILSKITALFKSKPNQSSEDITSRFYEETYIPFSSHSDFEKTIISQISEITKEKTPEEAFEEDLFKSIKNCLDFKNQFRAIEVFKSSMLGKSDSEIFHFIEKLEKSLNIQSRFPIFHFEIIKIFLPQKISELTELGKKHIENASAISFDDFIYLLEQGFYPSEGSILKLYILGSNNKLNSLKERGEKFNFLIPNLNEFSAINPSNENDDADFFVQRLNDLKSNIGKPLKTLIDNNS